MTSESATTNYYSPHPLRIQRKRTKGWRLPEDAVCVSRPSRWGNPFETEKQFRDVLTIIATTTHGTHDVGCGIVDFGRVAGIWQGIEELRGKQLACWCPLDRPCHADVIAEFANAECE